MSGDRLRVMEELAAHQARTLEELSAEIALQGETIRRLQKKLDALADRFMALEQSTTPTNDVTRPPHW